MIISCLRWSVRRFDTNSCQNAVSCTGLWIMLAHMSNKLDIPPMYVTQCDWPSKSWSSSYLYHLIYWVLLSSEVKCHTVTSQLLHMLVDTAMTVDVFNLFSFIPLIIWDDVFWLICWFTYQSNDCVMCLSDTLVGLHYVQAYYVPFIFESTIICRCSSVGFKYCIYY